MKNYCFQTYEKIALVPQKWDDIAGDNRFLKKDFLRFLEEVNPCDQRYHMSVERKIIVVTYKLKLDMFTYRKYLSLSVPIRIVGLPISVAATGYSCDAKDLEYLCNYLGKLPLALVLNTDGELRLPKGKTLSTYTLTLEASFGEYLAKMRSHYRYRVGKALDKGKLLSYEKIQAKTFTKDMYRLYEDIYNRSEGKLEKLSLQYFQKSTAELYVVKDESQKVIAFFQVQEFNRELIFLFCGMERKMNKRYDLYMNILLQMVKIGTERRLIKLNLGQTTKHTKTSIGAEEVEKYLHITSRFIPKIIGDLIAKKLDKPEEVKNKRVFREGI